MYTGMYPPEINNKISVFFLRTTPGTVALPISIDDAKQTMPEYFDFGVLNGHPLYMLNQALTKLYTPLLSYRTERPEEQFIEKKSKSKEETSDKKGADKVNEEKAMRKRINEAKVAASLRDEFLITMQKFVSHIDLTIRQIEGEIKFAIPDVQLPDDLTGIEKNEQLMNILETAVYSWEGQIASAIEGQISKIPKGEGPLAEIDYWKERNISLSGIYEQTKQDNVKRIVDILTHIESPAAASFEDQRKDLAKLYNEAKDNVRFLSTLERHFKNICYGSSFHVVCETLPSMMNSLRMIWIISRHYNTDERMVALMERIAWELSERVSRVINIKTIFDLKPAEVKKLCTEARKMLLLWKDTYLRVREKIEQSGRDSRWEFDRKKLFQKTDYQAVICSEIIKISDVLEEFYNIFGPDLKAVTGEPKRIEEVLSRVRNLVTRLKNVS